MSYRDFFMVGYENAVGFFETVFEQTGLRLTSRARNCLVAENCCNRDRLLGITQYDLRRIPNMGEISLAKVLEVQHRLRIHMTVVEGCFLPNVVKRQVRNRTAGSVNTKLYAVDDNTYNPTRTSWVVVVKTTRPTAYTYTTYDNLESLYKEHTDLTPPTPVIRVVVAAACRFLGDVVIVSSRHFDANMHVGIDTLMQARGLTDLEVMHNYEEGFVDQFGVWMSRGEALKVATVSGQLNRYRPKRGHEGELFSEDLY